MVTCRAGHHQPPRRGLWLTRQGKALELRRMVQGGPFHQTRPAVAARRGVGRSRRWRAGRGRRGGRGSPRVRGTQPVRDPVRAGVEVPARRLEARARRRPRTGLGRVTGNGRHDAGGRGGGTVRACGPAALATTVGALAEAAQDLLGREPLGRYCQGAAGRGRGHTRARGGGGYGRAGRPADARSGDRSRHRNRFHRGGLRRAGAASVQPTRRDTQACGANTTAATGGRMRIGSVDSGVTSAQSFAPRIA